MYKHVSLLVRPTAMNQETFVTHWQRHLDQGIEGVVRSHFVDPVDPERSEFDGLVELVADDSTILTIQGVESTDQSSQPQFIGEVLVEKDEVEGTDGLYKHSAFLVRKEGMSHEAFCEHWANEHVPLAREIPGVVRYVRLVPLDPGSTAFDGVAELYFEDLAALRAGLGHESSRDYDPDHPKAKAPREDVDNFIEIGDRPRFVGQERVITDESEREDEQDTV